MLNIETITFCQGKELQLFIVSALRFQENSENSTSFGDINLFTAKSEKSIYTTDIKAIQKFQGSLEI